jgi:hypothetical protein
VSQLDKKNMVALRQECQQQYATAAYGIMRSSGFCSQLVIGASCCCFRCIVSAQVERIEVEKLKAVGLRNRVAAMQEVSRAS